MAVLWSVVTWCHAKVSENGLVHGLKRGRIDRHKWSRNATASHLEKETLLTCKISSRNCPIGTDIQYMETMITMHLPCLCNFMYHNHHITRPVRRFLTVSSKVKSFASIQHYVLASCCSSLLCLVTSMTCAVWVRLLVLLPALLKFLHFLVKMCTRLLFRKINLDWCQSLYFYPRVQISYPYKRRGRAKCIVHFCSWNFCTKIGLKCFYNSDFSENFDRLFWMSFPLS
jgi:hypothetical protein